MFGRKLIRTGSALLMILALSLPALTPSALAVASVTGASPSTGITAGGQTITVFGTDFLPSDCTAAQMNQAGITTVIFDPLGTASSGTTVTVIDDGSLTVVTPAHAAGSVTIQVNQAVPAPTACTTPPGGPSSMTSGAAIFTYVAATPTATTVPAPFTVSPATGPDEGGNTVTITGSGFSGVTSVTFCESADADPAVQCSPAVITSSSATSIVVPAPPAPAGTTLGTELISIVVAATTGSGTCTGCYRYFELSVTSSTPSGVGPAGAAMTLTGTGFNPGALTQVVFTDIFGTILAQATGEVANQAGTSVAFTLPATTPAASGLLCAEGPVAPDPTPFPAPGADSLCVAFTVTAAVTGTVTPTPIPGTSTVSGTVTGSAGGGDTVALVNIGTGASFATTTTAAGTWSIPGVPAGTYRLSVAANNPDVTGCAVSTNCGFLISTQQVTVSSTGTMTPATAATITLLPKISPAAAVAPAAGVFGYAVNASTGDPIVGATVEATQGGAQVGTATTDANGRFEIAGLPVGSTIVTLVASATVGLSCTIGGINTCTDTITLLAGWNDPAFLALPSAIGSGQGVLQGVIPLVFRDTDTSRTGGVSIETDQIRVLNGGPFRTQACLDFSGSDSDGRRTTTQRQCLDLNPNAAGIFTGNIIPSGIMGMAEVFSVDLDGAPTAGTSCGGPPPTPVLPSATQGCVYDISDLHTAIVYRVAEADSATAGTNGLTCEDVAGSVAACGLSTLTSTLPITTNLSQNVVIPTVFKNYGGTPAKWDSVVNACMTTGVPGRQPLVIEFFGPGGPYIETRSADPGGCVTFNMRDISYLRDGVYAVNLTSSGLVGILPVPFPGSNITLPNAFFGAAVSYSRQGKLATAANGIGVAASGTTQIGTQSRVYVPLVFADYSTGGGSWSSGIGIVNHPSTGTSGSVSFSVSIYDDAGTNRGILNQRQSGQTQGVLWMGVQPGTENRGLWQDGQLVIPLERNFRGAVIIDAGDASGAARPFIFVHHTNYARFAAISYNGVRDQAINPTLYNLPSHASAGTRNCAMTTNTQLNPIAVPPGVCTWAIEANRVSRGPTTGVRLFNSSSTSELVDVQYFDSAGIEWVDSRTTFSIGPFSTATLFLGTDGRLPANFNGSLYVASQNNVVGIANVVDYGVTTRDGSRAYNLPTQSGFTQ